MNDTTALVELRFEEDARDCIPLAAASLSALDVEQSEAVRDPTIIAALTVAGSVAALIRELIKLAKELRASGRTRGVLLVKLDANNKEVSAAFLEATDEEINQFMMTK